MIAHKVASTIAAAATAATKKRKRIDIDVKHSQEPQLKKAFVDTGATDEIAKSYEHNEYQPITGAQLNNAGQVTITIENQDQFLHLHNSYLLIEGNVLKADNARYADADLIALTNNGLLYLFSSLTVEHVKSPGQATSFLGLASYSKVTYGMRDTRYDNDALFRTAAADAGKVVLPNLAWSVPIVQPNDVRKVNLYKSIVSNNVIPVSFRMRQCETFSVPQARSTVWRLGVSSTPEKLRWILVGLQTDKSGNQENNAALFDHCKLTNMQVWFFDFASRYNGIDNLVAGSAVSLTAFKSLYPIHVFDVSNQSERLTGVVNLTVRMEFSANVPANTQAYALVISDRMLKFKSDGSKTSALF